MLLRLFSSFLLLLLFLSSALSVAQTSVAPEKAQALFAKTKSLYEPIAKARGEEFFLEIHWDRTTVSAQAVRNELKKYGIGVDVGMLTSSRVSEDALALTLCHEAGHLFGGRPLRSVPAEWEGPIDESGKSLLTSEGQSDYYSTAVCFRKMVAGEDHRAALNGKEIPQRVTNLCDSVWGLRTSESYLCQRTALAGFSFLTMVMDFPISFNTPDKTVSDTTIADSYPSRQCRLDTLFAGALCKDVLPLDYERKDMQLNLCAEGVSARPACWFKTP
ncbi:hypothetical protein AZI85_13345 [Bdellovibrio bacteriovorus]|uniref:Peptidase M48 domain-containing protein n=1 Tax=Bdellovibrio bacteriovorus TaxID=959 RepID=A0A150WBP9_BDEBC|nr:hypothetical protein [Bdellovibrio bacteriovorus]KYG60445.1 hypothetical protein AZI85_13345 [Bdellovibrio bacteriovorus]